MQENGERLRMQEYSKAKDTGGLGRAEDADGDNGLTINICLLGEVGFFLCIKTHSKGEQKNEENEPKSSKMLHGGRGGGELRNLRPSLTT